MRIILSLIVGLGFLFRLLYLGKRQLWTDELIQALAARCDSMAAFLHQLKGGILLPTPLDFLIQKAFVSILGESAWTLRLHAAVFGGLSLWIFFRIASLLFGVRVALYSTFLFAILPLHYHYSQEGQPFALLTFLTLISFDLLLRIVSCRNRGWRAWAGFGVSLLLLLYTSSFAIAVIAAQLFCLVLAALSAKLNGHPGDGTPADGLPPVSWRIILLHALCSAAAIALFLPWALQFWTRPAIAAVWDIMNPRVLPRLVKELGDNSYAAAVFLLAGVVTGVRALQKHRRRQLLRWLVAWLLVPIPAVLFTDVLFGMNFAISQILPATPALALLAGYGLSYVGERMTILKELPFQISSPAIVYAAVLLCMSLWIARNHWSRETVDWRGAAAYLQETLQPGDMLTVPKAHSLLEYYSPGLAAYRHHSMDLDPGILAASPARRRVIVCTDGMVPDPCAGFRKGAERNRAWGRWSFLGFSTFVQQKGSLPETRTPKPQPKRAGTKQ